MKIPPALIGKAGEMLVAAELMRRGVEVAFPASDKGVDLLAYRLAAGEAVPNKIVPVQVKAHSGTGYTFLRSWFDRVPGLVLVNVWHLADRTPAVHIFESVRDVESALASHADTNSWRVEGEYTVTKPTERHLTLMKPHQDRWERITSQLSEL